MVDHTDEGIATWLAHEVADHWSGMHVGRIEYEPPRLVKFTLSTDDHAEARCVLAEEWADIVLDNDFSFTVTGNQDLDEREVLVMSVLEIFDLYSRGLYVYERTPLGRIRMRTLPEEGGAESWASFSRKRKDVAWLRLGRGADDGLA